MGKELVPLQDMQRLFVIAYVCNGANGTQAACKAGYSRKTARVIAQDLLAKPHVEAAVAAERSRVLGGEIGVLGVAVLRGILRDKNAKDSVRLDAAKVALSLAGHVAPKAPEPEQDHRDRPMSEWTAAELEAFIAKGRQAIENVEKPVISGTC